VTKAIEHVAERLGNTQAICRKSYVHPAIIEAYVDRSLVKTLKRQTEKELRGTLHRLSAEEAAVLVLLQQRMEQDLMGGRRPQTKKRNKSTRATAPGTRARRTTRRRKRNRDQ
jgi:DNA topoisomerase I